MEIVGWLQSQWGAISAAPLTYIGTIILMVLATAKFMLVLFGGEAAAARERSEYLKQRLADLEQDKSLLLTKLQVYGEDIAAVKQELEERPRISVGPEAPKYPKDGDLWVDTK